MSDVDAPRSGRAQLRGNSPIQYPSPYPRPEELRQRETRLQELRGTSLIEDSSPYPRTEAMRLQELREKTRSFWEDYTSKTRSLLRWKKGPPGSAPAREEQLKYPSMKRSAEIVDARANGTWVLRVGPDPDQVQLDNRPIAAKAPRIILTSDVLWEVALNELLRATAITGEKTNPFVRKHWEAAFLEKYACASKFLSSVS